MKNENSDFYMLKVKRLVTFLTKTKRKKDRLLLLFTAFFVLLLKIYVVGDQTKIITRYLARIIQGLSEGIFEQKLFQNGKTKISPYFAWPQFQ